MSDSPRLIIKAEQLGLFGRAPAKPAAKPAAAPAASKAPQGFAPIPNSTRGGYHKREGAKFVYWYPDTGIVGAPHAEDHPSVHAAHAAAEEQHQRLTQRAMDRNEGPKIKIVRINEAGEEEEIRPGAPKPATPPPAPPPVQPAAPVGKDGNGAVIDRDKRYTVWEKMSGGGWVIERSYSGAWFLPGSGGEGELTNPAKKVLPAGQGALATPPKPVEATPPAPPVEPAKPKAPSKPREAKPQTQEPLLTVQAGAEEAKGKYETTGYVFGSRAELAALRASGDLEKDPVVAYKLVTKKAVLGGEVEPSSFAAEMFAGTEPAAAYLKYRLMQSIQSRPDDSAEARERFGEAIMTAQKDLAELRTTTDVKAWIEEIGQQLMGVAPKETLTEEEMKARGWDVLFATPPSLRKLYSDHDYKQATPVQAVQMHAHEQASHDADYEIYRTLRKQARAAVSKHYYGEEGHQVDLRRVGDKFAVLSPMIAEAHDNAVNSLTTLGPRFLALVGYKVVYAHRKTRRGHAMTREDVERWYGKGAWDKTRIEAARDSEFRFGVMSEVGRIQGLDPGRGDLDEQGQQALAAAWGWLAGKGGGEGAEGGKGDTKTKRSDTEEGGDKYHTILAQERLGETTRKGPPVPGNAGVGSQDVKQALGLHEVEYGKWVSGKAAETTEAGRERQWHTEAAHAALFDLAHVMGVAPSDVGQKGRLTVAFGSRGSGSAAATYYPGGKVINITKLHGKGSLAHEWGHFLDHMIMHVSGSVRGKDINLTDIVAKGGQVGEAVPANVVHAMTQVMDAIMHEPVSAADAQRESRDHIEELRRAYYAEAPGSEKREQHRLELNAAVSVHNKAIRGRGSFKKPTVFRAAAEKMGDYWCRPHEMFARCFEAWVADRLEGGDRENTYLVKGTKGKTVAQNPGYFPQGEHRERVGKAMDGLAAALRADSHFQKAMPWSVWFRSVIRGPGLQVPQGDL